MIYKGFDPCEYVEECEVELRKVIERIEAVSIPGEATVTQVKHEEDNAPYQVWRIDTDQGKYILKEAKGNEQLLYSTALAAVKASVPALLQVLTVGEKTYLLLEYIEGEDLCSCDRAKLTRALDALISLQQQTWEMEAKDGLEGSFEKSLLQRRDRGRYLDDPQLEMAYERFLRLYQEVPKTLCHDDLLPFNVISGNERAALIDWECGGILPYPTAFARLIAHAEETQDALFYMTDADKRFAVQYYYDRLLKGKGISYTDWRNTLEYFLFYEYCEWVFVGHKYHETDGEYYKKYLPMAKKQAAKILSMENP